jgi:2-polyprenyl-3-methyl-5-hydroxy-6-metoxy-1,4-benzoquinol methylase
MDVKQGLGFYNFPAMEFTDDDRENLNACPWCGADELDDWGRSVRGFVSALCKGCGLIFVCNRLGGAGLEKYYKNYLSSVHQTDKEMNAKRTEMYRIEADFIDKFSPGGSVLDVGCSGGYFLDVLKEHGFRCHGVEFGEEAAAEAAGKHDVRQGDFTHLDLEDSFDLIVFRGVIEHIPDARGYLDRAVSLLDARGLIYITSTPNADAFCCSLFEEQWNQHEPEAHLMHFRPAHFDQYFAAAGMEKVAEHYFYEETPYADPETDILKVAEAINLRRAGRPVEFRSPSFWGNMMSLVYRRRDGSHG